MSLRKSVSYAVLSLALAAGPAAADVNGPQVWSDWKDYWEGFGYDVAGTESQSGEVLTVTDITMSMDLPEEEGTFNINMGTLTFTDTGSGTVSVGLPTSLPISFDMTPAAGEAVKGSIVMEQDAPTMIVSGDPGDFTYTYAAQQARMSMGDITVEGQTLPPEMFNMVITMDDLSSTTRTTVGELRGYDGTTSMSSLSYDINFDIPEGPDAGSGKFVGAMNGLTFTGGGQFTKTDDPSDINAMLEAGFDVNGAFSYDSGSSTIDVVSPDGPVSGTTSSSGGTLSVKMGADGLRYDVSQKDLSVTMQVPDLPFPVSLDMAEAGFVFGMPVQVRDDPQEFAFGFTMGDFTISDAIWNMVDPAGQLPRDPATLALSLTGTAQMLANILDPEAMARGETPGEINSLNIGDIVIRAVGAEITGQGDFTFDNTDTATFGGVPRPEGALDVRVEGANKLIDTLVNMRLLPEEQAMGARMMMGLFGVPDGDDALTSKIEINDQGHVLANGQRLR